MAPEFPHHKRVFLDARAGIDKDRIVLLWSCLSGSLLAVQEGRRAQGQGRDRLLATQTLHCALQTTKRKSVSRDRADSHCAVFCDRSLASSSSFLKVDSLAAPPLLLFGVLVAATLAGIPTATPSGWEGGEGVCGG